MMETVRDIIHAHGHPSVDVMGVGDHIEIERANDAMMPLVIEKIGEHRLSVAHYYTQMGDLMADPEIVFTINGETWVPVRYVQHPHTEQSEPDGLAMDGFVTQWNRNLREQGYVTAAQGGSQ